MQVSKLAHLGSYRIYATNRLFKGRLGQSDRLLHCILSDLAIAEYVDVLSVLYI